MSKRNKDYTILKGILLILLAFALMFYSLTPKLSDFRNSIWGDLINIAIIWGIILYVTLSKKISMPWLGKITLWAYALLYVVLPLLPIGHFRYLIMLIYSIVNVINSIIIYRRTKHEYKSIWIFGALAYLSTAFVVAKVHYINGKLPFLIPTIAVTAILFVVSFIVLFTTKMKFEPTSERIALPFCALLLGFCFTWLTLGSMNVYLDTSAPTYEEYVIVDKDIDAGPRRVTTYELKVERDGKTFNIGVSEETYYDMEIGDQITLSIYEGAFGEPYLIFDE